MSVRGITFEKQSTFSKDFAHYQYTFLNGASGITKGCEITHDTDNIYISDGYFIVFGRFIKIDGTETIITNEVLSGTKYCRLVFEIDLTQENTTDEFNQGAFKVLTSDSDYPTLTQEDLDDGGNVYQISFCKFLKTSAGIGSYLKEISNLTLSDVYAQITSELDDKRLEFYDYFDSKQEEIDALTQTAGYNAHVNDTDNPHEVTAAQIMETGTWTPVLKGNSDTAHPQQSSGGGYQIIGNRVRVWGFISTGSKSGWTASSTKIKGLPFAPTTPPGASISTIVESVYNFTNLNTTSGLIGLCGSIGTDGVTLYYQTNTSATNNLTNTVIADSFQCKFYFEYNK